MGGQGRATDSTPPAPCRPAWPERLAPLKEQRILLESVAAWGTGNDIGPAGGNICCQIDQLCIVSPEDITKAGCCPIGSESLCGSPCDKTEYQCSVTSTITNSATTTTVIQSCCLRPFSRHIAITNTMSYTSASCLTNSATLATQTSFVRDNPSPSLSSESTSTNSSNNPSWPVIVAPMSAITGMATLLAIYILWFRRRKSAKKEMERENDERARGFGLAKQSYPPRACRVYETRLSNLTLDLDQPENLAPSPLSRASKEAVSSTTP